MEKRVSRLHLAGLLLGLLLSLLYAQHQILTGDQTQMLYKGYLGALEGIWLSYGNAASAVGNVPGSLSAYLVGLPLLLWNSPLSPMLLLIALRLVSYLLFDNVIRHVFSPWARLLFLLLYWLNPWFLFETLLYNPSYLFLCSAMHCWSAFHLRERPSFVLTIIHVVAIGMAMQLHYSWPILALISTYLFYRRIIFIHWPGFISAIVLITVTLIPFLQELMTNHAIAQNADPGVHDRYIGWGGVHVYPVLKAVIYWFRYGSWIFPNKLITGAGFGWLTSLEWLHVTATYLWRTLVFGMGALSLLLAWWSNRFAWLKVRPLLFRNSGQPQDGETWLTLYAAAALLAVVVSAILSPIIFNYWHLMLAFPFALFPLLLFIHHWARGKEQKLLRYLLLAACYCLCINLVAANDSRKFSYQASYETQTLDYVSELKQEWTITPP